MPTPPRPPAARPRRPLAALLIAIASLLAVPASGHAVAWSTGAAFGTTVNSINVRAATSPDGAGFAAWLEIPGAAANNPNPPHTGGPLYVQHAAPDGTLGPVTSVAAIPSVGNANGDPTPSMTRISLVAGPNGTAVLAWAYPVTNTTTAVRLAFLTATGDVRRVVDLGSVNEDTVPALGVDASGTATLVYGDGSHLQAARITPDGAPTTTELAATSEAGVLAVAPGGTAWVAWRDNQQVQTLRLDPSGAVTAGPTPFDLETDYPAITVAPDGSGAAVVGVDGPSATVRGARLTSGGGLIANTFSAPTPIAPGTTFGPVVPTVALSPDGTVTLAVSFLLTDSSVVTVADRVTPNATVGVPINAFGAPGALFPALTAGLDGRVLAAWNAGAQGVAGPVSLRVIAADGTLGPIDPADTVASFAAIRQGGGYGPFETGLSPSFSPTGQLRLGVVEILSSGPGTARLRVGDGDPPTATATVPASATVGTAVSMSVEASDPGGIGGATWDFGDGSNASGASVKHTYGAPGTYTVAVTVTDKGGNATKITKTLTITAAPPTVVVQPAPKPAAPAPVLRPAKLVITKATRSGRKVTVTGTVTKTASGKVTITYTQRVGGATITQRKTAKIAKGRFTVVLTVPSAVTKAKSAAVVRVTYAGDADTLKGTTKHVVSKAKAKKKKSHKK